jgi:hypothetical protein
VTGSWVDTASGVLGIAMLIGVILFLCLYYCFSRWRETALGRHMLYFMVALALVLAFRAITVFWPGLVWVSYARLVTYLLLALAIWQRVYLLARTLHCEED